MFVAAPIFLFRNAHCSPTSLTAFPVVVLAGCLLPRNVSESSPSTLPTHGKAKGQGDRSQATRGRQDGTQLLHHATGGIGFLFSAAQLWFLHRTSSDCSRDRCCCCLVSLAACRPRLAGFARSARCGAPAAGHCLELQRSAIAETSHHHYHGTSSSCRHGHPRRRRRGDARHRDDVIVDSATTTRLTGQLPPTSVVESYLVRKGIRR